jgi:hypothetical protein
MGPPPYSPAPPVMDPMFTPNDPTVAQANYPQPPNSSHNQSPNPGKTATFLFFSKKLTNNSFYYSTLWTTATQY